MENGLFRSVQRPPRLLGFTCFLPFPPSGTYASSASISPLSFKDAKPGFYGSSEEPDRSLDGLFASPRLSGHRKLAHSQLEVKVCDGEHLAGWRFRSREGRSGEVVGLSSAAFAAVPLDVWPVGCPAVVYDFLRAAKWAYYSVRPSVAAEHPEDLLVGARQLQPGPAHML